MCEQVVEFLVIVLFDTVYLLSHATQLTNLVFDLVLELSDLFSQIIDSEFVQHDNIVVSVLTKETFEANGAEIILAESLDVLSRMDLAL